jgi:hypothetical protein
LRQAAFSGDEFSSALINSQHYRTKSTGLTKLGEANIFLGEVASFFSVERMQAGIPTEVLQKGTY